MLVPLTGFLSFRLGSKRWPCSESLDKNIFKDLLYASVLVITFTLCNNSLVNLEFNVHPCFSGFDVFSFILILIFWVTFLQMYLEDLITSFIIYFFHPIISTLCHFALNYCFVGFFFLIWIYYIILYVYQCWPCVIRIVSGFLSWVMIHITSFPPRFNMYRIMFVKIIIIINTTVVVLAVKLKGGGPPENESPSLTVEPPSKDCTWWRGNAPRPCHCDYGLLSQGNDAISRSRRPDWP